MVSRKFTVRFLVVALLSFTGALVYSVALQAPFVFDDEPNITKNHALQITSVTTENLKRVISDSPLKTRPVSNISFAFNYLLHGYDLTGYHLTNIFIHIVTSILLYCFVSFTLQLLYGGDKSQYVFTSLAAAMLWLLHPVQVQSVTYIVQRMNSMSVMFYMLSFVLYIKARQSSGRLVPLSLFFGALISWMLAMGSKEIAITLPFFLCLYELYFLQKNWISFRKRLLFFLLPLLVGVVTVYFVLGSHPLEQLLHGYVNRDFTLTERLYTEGRILMFYISLLFYPNPSRLNLQHDFSLSTSLFAPWTTISSLLGLVIMVIVVFFLFRRHRLLSFSLVWFLGNLLLESSFIPLELIFEHRLYLPSMAFCWLAVFYIIKLCSRERFGFILIICICLLFGFWSWQRNMVWASPLGFARDCAEKSPNLARVHGSYGEALLNAGDLSGAEREFQQTLRLKTDYPEAHNGLGLVYSAQGLEEAARDEYIKALELNPNYMRAYNNLGGLYLDLGKPGLAVNHLERAVKLRPDYIQAWYNLALAHESMGHSVKAEFAFLKALQFGPVFRVNIELGKFYYKQGKCANAKDEFLNLQRSYPERMNATKILDITESCLKKVDYMDETTNE